MCHYIDQTLISDNCLQMKNLPASFEKKNFSKSDRHLSLLNLAIAECVGRYLWSIMVSRVTSSILLHACIPIRHYNDKKGVKHDYSSIAANSCTVKECEPPVNMYGEKLYQYLILLYTFLQWL